MSVIVFFSMVHEGLAEVDYVDRVAVGADYEGYRLHPVIN